MIFDLETSGEFVGGFSIEQRIPAGDPALQEMFFFIRGFDELEGTFQLGRDLEEGSFEMFEGKMKLIIIMRHSHQLDCHRTLVLFSKDEVYFLMQKIYSTAERTGLEGEGRVWNEKTYRKK